MYLEQYNHWMKQENLELYLKEQLENMTETEKEDAFYRNLEFGTGGMRGVVGPGTNRMNVYTIRKANEGFAQYLLKNVENGLHPDRPILGGGIMGAKDIFEPRLGLAPNTYAFASFGNDAGIMGARMLVQKGENK